MAIRRVPEPICQGYQVTELGKFSFNINCRGKSRSAILIRFNGAVYGYLNQCVHMPRALDCEDVTIQTPTTKIIQSVTKKLYF